MGDTLNRRGGFLRRIDLDLAAGSLRVKSNVVEVGSRLHEGPPKTAAGRRPMTLAPSVAYEQANRWIATNGQCGLAAVKVGRMIRIPAAVLEAWATTGSDAKPISQSQ